MAKRKRLQPAKPSQTAGLETKSIFPVYRDGWEGTRPAPGSATSSAPIAQVAGDAAATAALNELSESITRAREEGRMILELDLDAVDAAYLVRDRLAVDTDDMHTLVESLRQRGQQTPIEVAALGDGRYGLISGWRRLQALRSLSEQEGKPRKVLALLRRPDTASEAYLAMVEENEIRVGLSYYERARIAAVAVEQGVFSDTREGLQYIYHSASRAKRSKIGSFLRIVAMLDGVLKFPSHISERAGLALAKALEQDAEVGARLAADLTARPATTVDEEAKRIERAIRAPKDKKPVSEVRSSPSSPPDQPENLPDGFAVIIHADGSLTLSGPALTEEMRKRLFNWIRDVSHAKQ